MFVILFSVKANSSIYIVDNYSFKTSLKKINNNRNKVIEDIKRKSLNDFLKSITIQSDYKNIKKINDYQNYFKYFIVKDELKTDNIYEVICKIEFDKFKIDDLLKSQNIKYINFKSNPVLTIVVEKKNNEINYWLNDSFEKNWSKKSNNLINAFPPNGDLTDINFLKEIDVKSYQITRVDRLTVNYGVRDFIFIVLDQDLDKEKENVFVKYQFNELKFSNKFKLKEFNQTNIDELFDKLILELNNSWKEIQILSPLKNNNFVFHYTLKKLSDYVEIKKILEKNKNIISLDDIEVTNSKYSGNLVFSGSKVNFIESLAEFNLIIENKNGNINLKKND